MPLIDLEKPADDRPFDETDVSLRAYFSRMPDDRLKSFRFDWSDKQVMEWDDNFRCDGVLMLVCCERDVDVEEYKQVLREHLRLRGLDGDNDRVNG